MTFNWNEMHCKDCQVTFDGAVEIDYVDEHTPCCPRCGSRRLEAFRIEGKIVKL